jgi:tRNA threonylcarbamoyladenosine biosynthesis protein TsaE
MPAPEWTLIVEGEAAMGELGMALAHVATAHLPLAVALVGDLGTGKTRLAQGVGVGLGLQTDVVSPTFALVCEHEGPVPLLHADIYRLQADELPGIGLEEQLELWEGLALVEWADRAPTILPLDHLQITLRAPEPGHRLVEVRATGPRAEGVLVAWKEAWTQ